MNGDSKTGVTIMEMAKKLDAGKIYSMEESVIEDSDNAECSTGSGICQGTELRHRVG